MKYYAVFDTNVLVSALMNEGSPPGLLIDKVFKQCIIPLFSDDILTEYEDVLFRKKFPFLEYDIRNMIDSIKRRGLRVEAGSVEIDIPDLDDVVFYAVVMEKRKEGDAYLITGNQKHFPKEPFVVTPREMLTIIEAEIAEETTTSL